MDDQSIVNTVKLFNILDLFGICAIIAAAFVFQFVFHELPCPLCLMQRLGIMAISFGFLLNVHYRVRPCHYALSLLAAVFTGLVAARQVLLHIVPGTGSYGSAVFGLHMYTWVLIVSVAAVIYIGIMLCIPGQYANKEAGCHITEARKPWICSLGHIAFVCLVALLIANIFSTYMECGIKECAENPTQYVV